ncbi:MAG: T9SS type A sorting domain-containing protein [Bacteroidetes bacterium]|nr:T9SS type A sorting domain-containing protein [Fibrella sp.]
MKQTLRLYGCILGLLLAASLRAQSLPSTRSRLELGRSKAPASTENKFKNFLFLRHAETANLDRSVTLHKNVALNDYYRSLLIAPAATRVTNTPRPQVQAESTGSATVQTEPRPVVVENLRTSEDLMFANDRIIVSNVYPNPASESAEIDYVLTSGEAKITLLNVLGTPVAEYTLDRSDRKLRIPTRTMDTGVYLYLLSLDGRKVATKKLLVRHQ